MNLRSIPALLLIAASLAACAPSRVANRQLVFDEAQPLVITARKAEKPAAGSPIRANLTREHYRIEFDMPVGPYPRLLLRAHTLDGAPLSIEGAHVHSAHPDTTDSSGARLFYFDVNASKGAPLEIIVRDVAGVELGRERLTWRARSHRASYGIEWI